MSGARPVVWRAALMVAVLMVAVFGSASVGVARASPLPDPPDQRTYYVVQPSDSLYQIAVETLGNGNRYREILALNGGDPMTLQSGSVLALPADAHGPGVATTPPATTPSAIASPRQRTVPVPVLVVLVALAAIAAGALWTLMSRVRRAAVAGMARGGRERILRTARQIGSHLSRARAAPAAACPVRPASAEEEAAPLTATLVTECGPIGVELTGRPAYRWLGVFDPAPESSLPVVLGLHEGARLFVDLADCPDPFTITGSAQDRRRYAAGLARQLLAHGRLVQVVGDVLGVDQPDGCERVTTMPALTGTSARDRARLVITAGLRGHSLADLRQCLRDDDRQVAVIIIGDVLRSRWSVSLPPRGVTAQGVPVPAAVEGATP